MSKRNRSKLQMFAVAVGIAVTVLGVLVVSAPRSEAAFDAFLRINVCHAQSDGDYIEISTWSWGAAGHTSHKEDVILPSSSPCPDKVARPSR